MDDGKMEVVDDASDDGNHNNADGDNGSGV